MRSKEEIFQVIALAKSTDELKSILAEINQLLEKEVNNIELIEHRAIIFEKLEQYGSAINDYKKILEAVPDNKQAIYKVEMLTTILRYTNTDIYASPNTNMDPWME